MTSYSRPILASLCAILVFTGLPAFSQDYKFTIPTAQTWTDTGVDLHSGDALAITATSGSNGCDPTGVSGTGAASGLPLPNAMPGALIARVQEGGSPMLVGPSQELHATGDGHLYLGVNAAGTAPCQGSFSVKVHITPQGGAHIQSEAATPATGETLAQKSPAPTSTTPAPTANSGQPKSTGGSGDVKDIKGALNTAAQTWLSGQFGIKPTTGTQPAASSAATEGGSSTTTPSTPALPALKLSNSPLDSQLREHINSLPRRVNDQFQNQGDMVNFVIIGNLQKVQDALTAADWHVADRDVKESVLKAALETYQKKAYLAMPMSELYLFGRVQDFGYEQAEPYAVVASRHHFRIWKAPFQYNGQDVWAGAGTHDIGFEKDQRNGKVTHKIDPAVDGERDNVGATLQKTDKIKTLTYYLPPDPVQDARNATGGGYHSDGRILVVQLQ
jgi:LssY C-terminus